MKHIQNNEHRYVKGGKDVEERSGNCPVNTGDASWLHSQLHRKIPFEHLAVRSTRRTSGKHKNAPPLRHALIGRTRHTKRLMTIMSAHEKLYKGRGISICYVY